MTLKVYKPTTPGRRGLVLVDRSKVWKGRPEKSLVQGAVRTGGRNVHGRITMRHRGGGHRRLHREIDFKRLKDGLVASVERLEYDPFRTTFLALLQYSDGEKAYILAPEGLKEGDTVVSGDSVDIKPGHALPLANIPPGTCVFNVELKVKKGGQLARSAGAFAQIMGREADYTLLRLASGELRRVLSACRATVGVASNSDNRNVSLAKAGRNRWKGKRPHVRGEAMNPVDHPHGGRTRGGRHPVSPWGTPAKGYKTRHNKRTQQFIVRGRKKK